jgi:hypothetical protein
MTSITIRIQHCLIYHSVSPVLASLAAVNHLVFRFDTLLIPTCAQMAVIAYLYIDSGRVVVIVETRDNFVVGFLAVKLVRRG